jgi:hypothetical protein
VGVYDFFPCSRFSINQAICMINHANYLAGLGGQMLPFPPVADPGILKGVVEIFLDDFLSSFHWRGGWISNFFPKFPKISI